MLNQSVSVIHIMHYGETVVYKPADDGREATDCYESFPMLFALAVGFQESQLMKQGFTDRNLCLKVI